MEKATVIQRINVHVSVNACNMWYFPISIPCPKQEVCYVCVCYSVDHTVGLAFCVFRWYFASASCTICLQMLPIIFH